MDQVDRSCDIATTPIAPNKPIAIGLCVLSGTMGIKPIIGIWVRRRLKVSYPIWRFNKRSPPPPNVRSSIQLVFLYKISMIRSPLETLTMPYPNFAAFCMPSARRHLPYPRLSPIAVSHPMVLNPKNDKTPPLYLRNGVSMFTP